jgi:hypothetical protein
MGFLPGVFFGVLVCKAEWFVAAVLILIKSGGQFARYLTH